MVVKIFFSVVTCCCQTNKQKKQQHVIKGYWALHIYTHVLSRDVAPLLECNIIPQKNACKWCELSNFIRFHVVWLIIHKKCENWSLQCLFYHFCLRTSVSHTAWCIGGFCLFVIDAEIASSYSANIVCYIWCNEAEKILHQYYLTMCRYWKTLHHTNMHYNLSVIGLWSWHAWNMYIHSYFHSSEQKNIFISIASMFLSYGMQFNLSGFIISVKLLFLKLSKCFILTQNFYIDTELYVHWIKMQQLWMPLFWKQKRRVKCVCVISDGSFCLWTF